MSRKDNEMPRIFSELWSALSNLIALFDRHEIGP